MLVRKLQLIAISVISLLFVSSCACDWQATRKTGTMHAYEAFLKKCPNDQKATEARSRLEELQEQSSLQVARSIDTPQAYERFTSKYPKTSHAHEIEKNINALRSDRASDILQVVGMLIDKAGAPVTGKTVYYIPTSQDGKSLKVAFGDDGFPANPFDVTDNGGVFRIQVNINSPFLRDDSGTFTIAIAFVDTVRGSGFQKIMTGSDESAVFRINKETTEMDLGKITVGK